MKNRKEYDQVTATHYAAFRPPLHQLILARCLNQGTFHKRGLDIGCGTGQSTAALTKYCEQVIGIDPSQDMLREAVVHSKIEYSSYNGKKLDFPDEHFDLITFAGSLFYAKSQYLLNEVIRICKPSTLVILYDFELLLSELFSILNLNLPIEESAYNHQIDFMGLKNDKLRKVSTKKDRIAINIAPSNLAHLLLSLSSIYKILREKYSPNDPYSQLSNVLAQLSKNQAYPMEVNLFYTVYRYI